MRCFFWQASYSFHLSGFILSVLLPIRTRTYRLITHRYGGALLQCYVIVLFDYNKRGVPQRNSGTILLHSNMCNQMSINFWSVPISWTFNLYPSLKPNVCFSTEKGTGEWNCTIPTCRGAEYDDGGDSPNATNATFA